MNGWKAFRYHAIAPQALANRSPPGQATPTFFAYAQTHPLPDETVPAVRILSTPRLPEEPRPEIRSDQACQSRVTGGYPRRSLKARREFSPDLQRRSLWPYREEPSRYQARSEIPNAPPIQ